MRQKLQIWITWPSNSSINVVKGARICGLLFLRNSALNRIRRMYRLLSGIIFSMLIAGQVAAVEMPLVDLDGKETNLTRYHGKWVVVNYWATWCPPCIIEMPELQSFHDDHADKDAVVIGINIENISKQQLQKFLDSIFISYPMYMVDPSQESELGSVPGLPTTFLVSPEGEVVARQIGPVTREMLEKFILEWQPQSL